MFSVLDDQRYDYVQFSLSSWNSNSAKVLFVRYILATDLWLTYMSVF